MPILWVLASRAGQATPATQAAAAQLSEALTVAGYFIAAGIAYWFAEREPEPVVDVYIDFDPDPTWQCEVHPYASCYGQGWGCQYSPI